MTVRLGTRSRVQGEVGVGICDGDGLSSARHTQQLRAIAGNAARLLRVSAAMLCSLSAE